MLCTIDLHCAPPICIVHHGVQGRPNLLRSRGHLLHFSCFGDSHGITAIFQVTSQWTWIRRCTRACTQNIVIQWFTAYIQIEVHNVVLYRHTLWWCTMCVSVCQLVSTHRLMYGHQTWYRDWPRWTLRQVNGQGHRSKVKVTWIKKRFFYLNDSIWNLCPWCDVTVWCNYDTWCHQMMSVGKRIMKCVTQEVG